jgi:hypothetical protein
MLLASLVINREVGELIDALRGIFSLARIRLPLIKVGDTVNNVAQIL